jgi:hypothetical protein
LRKPSFIESEEQQRFGLRHWKSDPCCGPRHPTLILKNERNSVFAKHVCERGVHPFGISDLQCELMILGKHRQEHSESCQELIIGFEYSRVEEWKLKQ